MVKNVVIFGPVDGGKSTLVGYLIAKRSENYDFERELSRIKKKLGDDYDPGQKFAYLTDTSDVERKRMGDREKQSTTKYTKPAKIILNNQEISIIDTPGLILDRRILYRHNKELPPLETRKTNRQQIMGMHLGDSGIFIVEISKIAKHDLLELDIVSKFFSPLFLWCKFRKTKRFVIVLSKIDKNNFSEGIFNKANKIIRTVLDRVLPQDITLDIIPISIDVKAEKDENVLTKCKEMSWYSGPTFLDKLENICQNFSEEKTKKPSIYFVEKYYKEVGIWGGKNLQGCLMKQSLIKMSPVEYKKIGYTSVMARIRNIQNVNGENTEIAESNSIVTLDLYDFKLKNEKKIQKENITTLRTTCIVDIDVPLSNGNILQFEVPLNKVDKFHMLESITIVWFGKYITSFVVNKIKNENNGLIFLELHKDMVSLPTSDNNQLVYDKFLLKLKNIFIPANLQKIGIPHTLNLIEYENIDQNKISDTFKDFKYEKIQDKLKFTCENSFIYLIKKIGDFYKTNDISSNISLETKELKEI